MEENDRAQGTYVEPCPGINAKMFAFFVGHFGNAEGINLEQFFQAMGSWMAVWGELKAAA